MLSIGNLASGPAEIGRQVSRKVVQDAGGVGNLRTFHLGPGLKVHRRCDDDRIRRPVNGRRGFKTFKFWSSKCGRDVHSESEGEYSHHSLIEIHPAIRTYRDQCDIVEIEDELGRSWSVPDTFVHLRDDTPVWLEGKYSRILKRDPDGLAQIAVGPSDKVKAKLKRIGRAFRRAGFGYVVVDQSWTNHPIVAANVRLCLASRSNDPDDRERAALSEIVSSGFTTVERCARAFAGRDCPEEWVCASMARGLIEIQLDAWFSRRSVVWPPSEPFWCRREQ